MLKTLERWLDIIKNQLVYLNNRFIKRILTHNFRMIFLSRVTLNSGTQLLGLFLPIFLYQFFDLSLYWVTIYYLVEYLLFLILMAGGCSFFINRFGINKSLQISIIFGSLHFASLFFLNQFILPDIDIFSVNYLWWLLPIIFFSTLFRLSHWIPYHTCISTLTDQNIRRSQFGLLEASILSTGVVMPFLAGIILNYLSYSYLFLAALVIYLFSLVFFFRLPKVSEKFTWGYKKAWRKFFSKKMRFNVLAYIGEGAESGIKIFIWPIFIWQILDGSYLQVGSVSAVIVAATIILQILLGDVIDRAKNKKFLLNYSAFFLVLAWVLKASVVNIFQIFIVSTFYNVVSVFTRTSLLPTHYDIAFSQGQYMDEYNLIREKSLMFGRVLTGLLILLLLIFFPINYIFYLAAIFSGLIVLLRKI